MTPTSRIPRILQLFGTMVVTSFYIFPFVPSFFPVANTKMVMAAIGIALLVMENLSDNRQFTVSKDFLLISFSAAMVGFVSLVSITYNKTRDAEFVNYITSAWVWMGGAYTASRLIKRVHGKISLELMGNYLVAVCTAQCLLAYSMTIFPGVEDFVSSLMAPSEAYMSDAKGRLHGLGCALDPAGFRFSATLIVLSALLCHRKPDLPQSATYGYLLCFFIISLFGNMISRSTMVGMSIGLGYIVFHSIFIPSAKGLKAKTWGVFFTILLIAIPLATYFYNTDDTFYEWMRFGFEGFFSLVEQGTWDVSSNEILKDMVVYPETTKTWLIGDGYINANAWDPYYLGENISVGYYMNTDIGYLRYIFYFGIIGLATFGMVFIISAVICSKVFPEYSLMFALMVLSNYIGWLKVSTDIFCMFAPFLVVTFQKQRELAYENNLLHPLHL